MLQLNINQVELSKDPISGTLINILKEINEEIDFGNSSLYHNFPLYRDIVEEESYKVQLLLLSSKYGVIIFSCINISRLILNIGEIEESLERIDRNLYSRFIRDKKLIKDQRNICFNLNSLIFSNSIDVKNKSNIVTSKKEIVQFLRNWKAENELSEQQFQITQAIIEGTRNLKVPKQRNLTQKSYITKGRILSNIENEIALFDDNQKEAAMYVVDGPQRIRGLAGSGKTIILSYKAAKIHLDNPEAEIVYTYYTKTLYTFIKTLITRFYRIYSDTDPNWDKIHIMHGWGGSNLSGVYYDCCISNGIQPLKFPEAQFYDQKQPFNAACKKLYEENLKPIYDYMLIDEAQDFPVYFYRVCRKITKNNRIIWAYDNFQNIFETEIQNEKETFGKDEFNNYYVDFSIMPKPHDIILHKCYRNPKEVLVSAFAVGLGIYNKPFGMVQRLEDNDHWNDLGFKVEKGDSKDDSDMIVSRPDENSLIIENSSTTNPIIQIKSFNDFPEECNYICEEIEKDIKTEELLPEDIVVICVDNKNVEKYMRNIDAILESKGIDSFNILLAPYTNKTFKYKNEVTLTTLNKAKGNESGSIYICGVDQILLNKNSILNRNRLFTAMTRAHAWLTITGMGEEVKYLEDELNALEKNKYDLVFKQPSSMKIKTILRDISKEQAEINEALRMIEKLRDIAKKQGKSEKDLEQNLGQAEKLFGGKDK